MRRLAAAIFACVWLSPLAFAQDSTYYDDSFARMNYVSGDTYVQRAQDLGTEAGTVNGTDWLFARMRITGPCLYHTGGIPVNAVIADIAFRRRCTTIKTHLSQAGAVVP